MASLVTLEQWAASIYGDAAPKLPTLRTWARDGKIYPAPQKHGRTYYVCSDAQYIDTRQPAPSRNREPKVRHGALVEKLINERKTA